MSDRFETFYYFSDVKLPEKITRLIKEARKECQEQRYFFSTLVVKDSDGNQIEIITRKDYERALQRYLSKHSKFELLNHALSGKRKIS